MANWLMGSLAAHDRYNPEEGAYQAELLRAEQPYRGQRLDVGQGGGFREAGSGVSPQAKAIEQFLFPQTPLDYGLSVATGPRLLGKGVKLGAAALGALFESDPAEAGKLATAKKAAAKISDLADSSTYGTVDTPPIAAGDKRVSTRFPTGKGATEDPLKQHLSIGTAEMKASPGYEHNVGLLSSYPGFARLQHMDHDQAVQAYLDQARGNLQYLYNRSPDVMRQRSPHWYEGAHEVSDALARRWGIPRQSSSAAIAALSPQMDWFKNASLAERLGDIVTGAAAGKRMTPEMIDWADNAKFIEPRTSKTGKIDTVNRDLYASIRGKSLDQLETPLQRALWVRIYDEAHNPRHYRSITPEGNFGEFIVNKDGSRSAVGWGQLGEIQKAVRAIESGGDMNLISPMLGAKHKVRNFYNNIELPNDPRFGDITADTHAVAAAQMRPLSGSSPAVQHNLMSGGAAGSINARASDLTGVQGTYGLLADATRMMAAEHGMLPRAAQSATWEPIRELFTDTFKRSSKAGAVDDVWRAFDRGEIGLDDARDRIFQLGGGIGTPEWARPGLATFAPTRGSTYR